MTAPAVTPQNETVDHHTLAKLQQAGAVSEATLVAEPEGWAVVVQIRRSLYPLAARRGGIRHWRRMESAVKYLAGQRITRFQVDARAFEALRATPTPRPDAAAKLRRAHGAAEYNAWLIREVEAAREDVAAGRVSPHEEVMADIEARIQRHRQRLREQSRET